MTEMFQWTMYDQIGESAVVCKFERFEAAERRAAADRGGLLLSTGVLREGTTRDNRRRR